MCTAVSVYCFIGCRHKERNIKQINTSSRNYTFHFVLMVLRLTDLDINSNLIKNKQNWKVTRNQGSVNVLHGVKIFNRL